MKRRCIIIVLTLVSLSTLCGCESTKKKLSLAEEKISELTERNNELQSQNEELTYKVAQLEATASSSDSQFINSYFWSDGNLYSETSGITFYSLPDCRSGSEISDELVFVSPQRLDMVLSSGIDVYVTRSTIGPVYSVYRPRFDVLE